jgi:hypothetical protein
MGGVQQMAAESQQLVLGRRRYANASRRFKIARD